MKLENLEKKIGYSFKDAELLTKALTHSSYAHEKRLGPREDNEALEFLGDSVVGLASANYFFHQFPDLREGELSKLKSAATNTLTLASLARDIGLDKLIILGKGELKSGGRKKASILADAFEALVGGIFLDGGFDPAEKMVIGLLADRTRKLNKKKFELNNYKSALQEHFLKSGKLPPVYGIVEEHGLPHKKKFVVEVLSGETVLARASGRSKKAAEQQAAAKVLKKLTGRKTFRISREIFALKK